jgi:hypothetical protein
VHDSWFGFAESRLRKLVEELEKERLLSEVYLFPREFRHVGSAATPAAAATTQPAAEGYVPAAVHVACELTSIRLLKHYQESRRYTKP